MPVQVVSVDFSDFLYPYGDSLSNLGSRSAQLSTLQSATLINVAKVKSEWTPIIPNPNRQNHSKPWSVLTQSPVSQSVVSLVQSSISTQVGPGYAPLSVWPLNKSQENLGPLFTQNPSPHSVVIVDPAWHSFISSHILSGYISIDA